MLGLFNLFDLLLAILVLGMPLVVLSWLLFSFLFETGEIGRDADHKLISARVKELKKSTRKVMKKTNVLYKKWMWFGSGFYGLAGLYTLVIIEIRELIGFLLNMPQLSAVFANGAVDAFVQFLISQLGNIIQAFLWWSYWPADSILVWLVVAYLGYWIGVELARRRKVQSIQDFRDHLNEFLPAIRRR